MKQLCITIILSIILNTGFGQTISTVAGVGSNGCTGDNGTATSAQLGYPTGIAVDSIGRIFVAEPTCHCIRMVNELGIITTVAGSNTAGFYGDGGPATLAMLDNPRDVAVDRNGNIYISDVSNGRIRKVNASGIITTLVGTGTAGYSGDGGPSTAAKIMTPSGVAVDAFGNVYLSDIANQRIRKVNTLGIISTIAGNGSIGSFGDGGLATRALFSYPTGVATDKHRNVYIADTYNQRIRKVDTNGIITTIAGTGTSGYSGDGGPSTNAQLYTPNSIAVDRSNNIYIAEFDNHCIRKIDTSGIISTVIGTGEAGYSGDGGAATAAKLTHPEGIAVDAYGSLYVADQYHCVIRKVTSIAAAVTELIIHASALQVFPNPTTDKVEIIFNNWPNKKHIVVIDFYGRTVAELTTNNSNYHLDMQPYPCGVYFVKAFTGGYSKQVSFVKQ